MEPVRLNYKPCTFPHQRLTTMRYCYLELNEHFVRNRGSMTGMWRPEDEPFQKMEERRYFFDYTILKRFIIGVDLGLSQKYEGLYMLTLLIPGGEDWTIWFEDYDAALEMYKIVWKYIFGKNQNDGKEN